MNISTIDWQTIALGVFVGMLAYRIANLALAAVAHALVMILAWIWPNTWASYAESLGRARR